MTAPEKPDDWMMPDSANVRFPVYRCKTHGAHDAIINVHDGVEMVPYCGRCLADLLAERGGRMVRDA